MFWACLQLTNWFADVNLFSVIELCSNGCRGLNISQLLGPRAPDIRLGIFWTLIWTIHVLDQLTGVAHSVFSGCDEPRADCPSSDVWCAVCWGPVLNQSPVGWWDGSWGDLFAAASSSPLYGNKWDLEHSCRQLISEQEVSWSMRLGEFNKCFFTGKQSKLLFKLLLVITFLVLNRPWLCLTCDVALSCYNFLMLFFDVLPFDNIFQ